MIFDNYSSQNPLILAFMEIMLVRKTAMFFRQVTLLFEDYHLRGVNVTYYANVVEKGRGRNQIAT